MNLPLEKSMISSAAASESCVIAGDASLSSSSLLVDGDTGRGSAGVGRGERGFFTLIMDLDDVSHMRGKTTNGRTIERTTCDATRSVFTPSLPTTTATTIEGINPRHRVKSRLTTG